MAGGKKALDEPRVRALKRKGFADSRIAKLIGVRRGRGQHAPSRARRPSRVQARRYLRRRVRDVHRVHVFHVRGRVRVRADRQAQDRDPRWRAQPHRPGHRVRLLLRARGARAARRRVRDHHGQLQPGDGLDRLRHLRPPVLRAADARGRHGDHARREAVRRDRAVRRPDAAQARQGAGSGGRADHRHQPGLDRRRRRPRAFPAAGREAAAAAAAEPHGAHRRRGRASRGRSRLPAGRAPELRARRPRDGSRLHRGRPARLHEHGRAGLERQPGAARPLPRPRDRSRRRRDLRRQGRLRRRHHGAHRAGGRALRRLRLLAAAQQPEQGAAGPDPRPDAPHGARAQRDRPDERAVRDPERRGLRARSEPARLAHGALRLEGDRRGDGEGGRARDDRSHAGRTQPDARARPEVSSRSRKRCSRSASSRTPTRSWARK